MTSTRGACYYCTGELARVTMLSYDKRFLAIRENEEFAALALALYKRFVDDTLLVLKGGKFVSWIKFRRLLEYANNLIDGIKLTLDQTEPGDETNLIPMLDMQIGSHKVKGIHYTFYMKSCAAQVAPSHKESISCEAFRRFARCRFEDGTFVDSDAVTSALIQYNGMMINAGYTRVVRMEAIAGAWDRFKMMEVKHQKIIKKPANLG